MQRFLLSAFIAAFFTTLGLPAFAAAPYIISIGYSFDTRNADNIADAHRIESKAINAYQFCAQATHVNQDQSGLSGCEIAYRKAISSIPHADFRFGVKGAGERHFTVLASLPVDVVTDRTFDRNLTHLETNDRYWQTGLVAYPGKCDVRVASTSTSIQAPFAVCTALGAYFTRELKSALDSHSDAAVALLTAGVPIDVSPFDYALRSAGMTERYITRLAGAGFPLDAHDASGLTVLQRELNAPRQFVPAPVACSADAPCPLRKPDPGNVTALISAGATVDEQTLDIAAKSGNADVVRIVAQHLPAATRACCWRESMRRAIGYGPSDVVDALVQSGWPVKEPMGTGVNFPNGVLECGDACTPLEIALADADIAVGSDAMNRMMFMLSYAGWRGSRGSDAAKMASVLLEHGADPNIHDGYPLWLAVRFCDGPGILNALFAHGARVSAVVTEHDHGLLSVAQHAIFQKDPLYQRDLPAILALLRSHGAKN
jgi:hypothetical protein